MRLTPSVIHAHPPFLNCLGLRTLLLRSLAIPTIENLAPVQNAVDLIDLSHNLISQISDGFPPLPRLTHLYLAHNRITSIHSGLATSCPNLHTLILTANRIATLRDLNLAELGKLSNLQVLALSDNPIQTLPDLKQSILQAIPSLRILNFEKVKRPHPPRSSSNSRSKNRNNSNSRKRKLESIHTPSKRPRRDTTPNDPAHIAVDNVNTRKKSAAKMTAEEKLAVRKLIQDAQTVEQVYAVQEAVRKGTVQSLLNRQHQEKKGHLKRPREEEENGRDGGAEIVALNHAENHEPSGDGDGGGDSRTG